MKTFKTSVFSTGEQPGSDGGEADDAAAADGGRPAVVGAGGELHGRQTCLDKPLISCFATELHRYLTFKYGLFRTDSNV